MTVEKLSLSAINVLERRYLLKDKSGKVIETPVQLFKRVARATAKAEERYNKPSKEIVSLEKEFFDLMNAREFLPNSPTLMNAGTMLGNLSACYVLPIDDSIESIFETLKITALLHQQAAGTGFSFSHIRPRGDIVRSTGGIASGPISFMEIYDKMTDVMKAGGKRRGANMGILDVSHPDILEFINVKTKKGMLENFNISVAVTDEFMKAAIKDEYYSLINPKDKKVIRTLNAKEVFDLIVKNSWKVGDPGLIFIDEINRRNPTKHIGKIEATNPCITEDNWIMTSAGPRQVKDIIGKKTEVLVNGKKWSNSGNGFFSTGIKEVFKLETKEGFEISLTYNHPVNTIKKATRYSINSEWKNAGELKAGDKILLNNHQNIEWSGKFSQREGYLMGYLIGDGTISTEKVILDSWGESEGNKRVREVIKDYAMTLPHRKNFNGWQCRKKEKKYRLVLSYLRKLINELKVSKTKEITSEIEKASSDFYIGFLKGFFDTDGSVQGSQEKGVSIRLAQSDIERLKAVQRMLLRLGIFSKIYKNRREAGFAKLPDGKGGTKEYPTKPQHELIISGENILKFIERVGFENSDKSNKAKMLIAKYKRKLNKERFIATFNALIPEESKEVYDIQVPGINAFDANGIVLHNCGEVPLHPWEACNLGSINLSRMFKKNNKEFDWKKLKKIIPICIRFLDDVIDVSTYPEKQIEDIVKANRRIGLGVMGLAECLIKLGIPYNSDKALKFADRLMKFIEKEAVSASQNIAKEKGSFPNFKGSLWAKKLKYMRNAAVTSIAPTGTISIIADCSSGIEPLFAVAFMRNILDKHFLEIDPVFEEIAKKHKFHSDILIDKITRSGSIQKFSEIPEKVRKLFVTALDIEPEWHVKMQSIFQKYVDSAVSKTINMPKETSAEKVKEALLLAWKLKCKGITIYRYGSRENQVLTISPKGVIVADPEFSGGCEGTICPH